MAAQNLGGTISGHHIAIAGSAFALGVVTGLFLKEAGKQMGERARTARWHHEYEQTVTYAQNLPDSLARREPSPQADQPRFGGTGAIGVSPASAGTAPSKQTTTAGRDNTS